MNVSFYLKLMHRILDWIIQIIYRRNLLKHLQEDSPFNYLSKKKFIYFKLSLIITSKINMLDKRPSKASPEQQKEFQLIP